MARWIYQRPLDCCNPTELAVAKRLARLAEEWVIRWGFYYQTDREGDFLILGPTGGVLVLEMKNNPRLSGLSEASIEPDRFLCSFEQ